MINITREEYIRMHWEHGYKITKRRASPDLPDEQTEFYIKDKVFLVSVAPKRGFLIKKPLYYISEEFAHWLAQEIDGTKKYHTTDGGKLAPHPDMTEADLRDFEAWVDEVATDYQDPLIIAILVVVILLVWVIAALL